MKMQHHLSTSNGKRQHIGHIKWMPHASSGCQLDACEVAKVQLA